MGVVEGRLAILAYPSDRAESPPGHFVFLTWDGRSISHIRDSLYAPHAMPQVRYFLPGREKEMNE